MDYKERIRALREDNDYTQSRIAGLLNIGPTPMLRALKAYSQEKGIPCYLSLEEKMACGIGACLACTCQTKDVDEHSQVHNKRICKDGPVFLAEDIEL